jgi:hypothetical protein
MTLAFFQGLLCSGIGFAGRIIKERGKVSYDRQHE